MKRKFLMGTAAILKPYVPPKPKGQVISVHDGDRQLQRVFSTPGFGEWSLDDRTGALTVGPGTTQIRYTYAHEVVQKARRGHRYE